MKRTKGTEWSGKLTMAIMTAGIMLLTGLTAFAAPTVSVSADKTNIQISDTVTVSVEASQPEDDSFAPQIRITYDPSLLEYSSCDVECGGGGGQLTLSSVNANIQFKALAEGSAEVSVEATLSEDGGSPIAGSATVTVGTPSGTGMSSDATMRALSVNPGSMSPAFSPTVTDYTITIDDSTTDITVSGAVTDEKARITTAYGFKNLQAGDSDAVITVTAEDESTLTYNFHIVRGDVAAAAAAVDNTPDPPKTEEDPQPQQEGNKLSVGAGAGAQPAVSGGNLTFAVDGVTYQISRGFDTGLLPQGCVKTDVTVQGQTVQGAAFEAGGLMLVYAVSGADGTGDFYICDAETESYMLFVQIPTAGSGYIVPVSSIGAAPDGFEAVMMKQGNALVPAYQAKKSKDPNAKDFYLLYAVNETGDSGYYLYDALVGTCQRYVSLTDGTVRGTKGSFGSSVIIGMMAIVMVGLGVVILLVVLRNRELAKELEEKKAQIMPYMSEKLAKQKAKENDDKETAAKTQKEAEKAAPEQKKKVQPAEAASEQKKKVQPAETAPEKEQKPAQEIGIEIKDVEPYTPPSEEEKARQAALQAELEEKQRAARKAALEREIQKDEKARAKQEAQQQKKAQHMMKQVQREAEAERRAMEKLLAAEQLREQKLAMKRQESVQANPEKKEMAGAAAGVPKPAVRRETAGAAAGVPKPAVRKESAGQPVMPAAGQKPAAAGSGKQDDNKMSQVPIFTLENKSVSLTRKPAPSELDDDFEFEFINIDQD